MLVADPPQPLEEPVLGDDVPALALDRLDDDRRDLVGRRQPVEQDLVEPAQVLDPPERRVEDAGQQRTEVRVVLGLRCGQAHRTVGAAVEGAEERDDVRPLRREPGELDGRLDDLGPGVAEVGPRPSGHRGEPGQLAAHLGVDRQVEVAGAEVDELGRLFLDGGHHLRMRVARRGDRDARREVEEEVAVDVLDGQALAADRHDRVGPRQARRGPGLIERHVRPGLRAGHLGDDVGNGSVARDARRGRGQGAPHACGMHRAYARWIRQPSIPFGDVRVPARRMPGGDSPDG